MEDVMGEVPLASGQAGERSLPKGHCPAMGVQPAGQSRSKRRRPRKGKVYPAPAYSGRLYVKIDAGQVHMFRYLLEAEDNLGIMTVVDRWGAVLLVRFSPHQERELREWLAGMMEAVPFTILPVATLAADAAK